jgi:hypothetical protein
MARGGLQPLGDEKDITGSFPFGAGRAREA